MKPYHNCSIRHPRTSVKNSFDQKMQHDKHTHTQNVSKIYVQNVKTFYSVFYLNFTFNIDCFDNLLSQFSMLK